MEYQQKEKEREIYKSETLSQDDYEYSMSNSLIDSKRYNSNNQLDSKRYNSNNQSNSISGNKVQIVPKLNFNSFNENNLNVNELLNKNTSRSKTCIRTNSSRTQYQLPEYEQVNLSIPKLPSQSLNPIINKTGGNLFQNNLMLSNKVEQDYQNEPSELIQCKIKLKYYEEEMNNIIRHQENEINKKITKLNDDQSKELTYYEDRQNDIDENQCKLTLDYNLLVEQYSYTSNQNDHQLNQISILIQEIEHKDLQIKNIVEMNKSIENEDSSTNCNSKISSILRTCSQNTLNANQSNVENDDLYQQTINKTNQQYQINIIRNDIQNEIQNQSNHNSSNSIIINYDQQQQNKIRNVNEISENDCDNNSNIDCVNKLNLHLKHENFKLKKENQDLSKTIDDLETKNYDMHEQKIESKSGCQTFRIRSKLDESLKENFLMYQNYDKIIKGKEKQLEQLNHKITENNEKIQILNDKLFKCLEDYDNEKNSKCELRKQIDALQTKIEVYKSELNERRKTIQQYVIENDKLKGEIEQYQLKAIQDVVDHNKKLSETTFTI